MRFIYSLLRQRVATSGSCQAATIVEKGKGYLKLWQKLQHEYDHAQKFWVLHRENLDVLHTLDRATFRVRFANEGEVVDDSNRAFVLTKDQLDKEMEDCKNKINDSETKMAAALRQYRFLSQLDNTGVECPVCLESLGNETTLLPCEKVSKSAFVSAFEARPTRLGGQSYVAPRMCRILTGPSGLMSRWAHVLQAVPWASVEDRDC